LAQLGQLPGIGIPPGEWPRQFAECGIDFLFKNIQLFSCADQCIAQGCVPGSCCLGELLAKLPFQSGFLGQQLVLRQTRLLPGSEAGGLLLLDQLCGLSAEAIARLDGDQFSDGCRLHEICNHSDDKKRDRHQWQSQ
jgi:hypothetical protein